MVVMRKDIIRLPTVYFLFSIIAYPCEVPIWHLRFLPALCGSMLTPLTFYILEGMGFSQWTAAVGAFLVVCGESSKLLHIMAM